jgi:hypothetical protein
MMLIHIWRGRKGRERGFLQLIQASERIYTAKVFQIERKNMYMSSIPQVHTVAVDLKFSVFGFRGYSTPSHIPGP